MKKLILLFIVSILYAEDIVYLKNGEEIRGKVISIEKFRVKVEIKGKKRAIKISDITSITFDKIRPGSSWNTIKDIDDTTLINAIKDNSYRTISSGMNYVDIYRIDRVYTHKDSIILEKRVIRRFLTPTGTNMSTFLFDYPEEASFEVIFARTVLPDGHVVSIKPDAIERISASSFPPGYPLWKGQKVALPGAVVNAVMDFKIRIAYAKTNSLRPFYRRFLFSDFMPIAHYILFVEDKLNVFEHGIENVVERKTIKNYIMFKRDKIRAIPYESMASSASYFSPIVYVYSSFKRWKDLAAEYIKAWEENTDFRYVNDFKGFKNIDSLFLFINRTVNDFGGSPQKYGYVPHNVNEVYKNSYGSVFDKAALFYSLLKKRGFLPQIYLVSYIDERFEEQVPVLKQFDNVLIAVKDRIYDFSNRYNPYNYYSSKTDRLALNVLSGDIVDITENFSVKNKRVQTLDAYFREDTLFYVDRTVLFGAPSVEIKALLNTETEESFRKYIESFVSSEYKGSYLDSFTIVSKDVGIDSLVLDLYYHKPFSFVKVDRYIFLDMPIPEVNTYIFGSEKRYTPVFFGEEYLVERNIRILLPKGVKVYYKPQNIAFDNKYAEYSFQIGEKANLLNLDYREKGKKKLLPQKDYTAYRDQLLRFASINYEHIILKKK